MATWITHLMVADAVLQKKPQLDRRGFCVGNIAPDCNIENEDWTDFDPPREVTHWMSGSNKTSDNAERFLQAHFLKRMDKIGSAEEYAFLLGYYSHLVADAVYADMIRDPERVEAVWKRIDADAVLSEKSKGMDRTWDSVKMLIPKMERLLETSTIEANYLLNHPDSGFNTEILTLTDYPDYLDYFPKGAITRKAGVIKRSAENFSTSAEKLITITEREVEGFVKKTESIILLRFNGIF